MRYRLLAPLLLIGSHCMAAGDAERSPAAGSNSALQVDQIVAGLPWRFDVSTTRHAATDSPADGNKPVSTAGVTHHFVSAEPYRRTARGPLFLRAELKLEHFDSPRQAEQAFQRIAGEAQPDMGLSYAWDHLILSDRSLLRLHAGCAFSAQNFLQMVGALERLAAAAEAGGVRSLQCRCGGGCRELPPPAAH